MRHTGAGIDVAAAAADLEMGEGTRDGLNTIIDAVYDAGGKSNTSGILQMGWAVLMWLIPMQGCCRCCSGHRWLEGCRLAIRGAQC
jgi:hypothetical protein